MVSLLQTSLRTHVLTSSDYLSENQNSSKLPRLSVASPAPRKSWLDSIFKSNSASFSLLSVHGAKPTRDECVRILEALGVNVQIEDAPMHKSSIVGVLRCQFDEIIGK